MSRLMRLTARFLCVVGLLVNSLPCPAVLQPDYHVGAADELDVALPINGSLSDLSRLGGDLPIEVVNNTVFWVHHVRVTPDGFIYLPNLPPLHVGGSTLTTIQQLIRSQLETTDQRANVFVTLKQANNDSFYVMGEVKNPGRYPLERPTTLMDAIGYAGGIGERGKANHVLYLHGDLPPQVIDFSAEHLNQPNPLRDIHLTPEDSIIVPRKKTPDSFTVLLIITAISTATGIYVATKQ